MSEKCPQCHKEIPAGSPMGLCPRCCLTGIGAESGGGEEIPGIELGEALGRGSFGDVFEGVQLTVGYRRVAVKILRDEAMGGAQRARFMEEIQLLGMLEHDHIAKMFGSGRTAHGLPYYVMELIEGEDLGKWAEGKSREERMDVLCQISSAVGYAHSKGVAHRDLKPGNILVADDGVKVIDFGIARAFLGPASWGREGTAIEQRMGTPAYMSPEQLAGSSDVDLRTDVWSLGLLIYELELGHPILESVIDQEKTWEENGAEVKKFVFPVLGDRELDWIARKACALKPEDRYQSGSALLEDLEAKRKGEAVSVGMSYTGYRLRKAMAKNRLAVAIAAAVAFSILVVAVSGWLMGAKERTARMAISESLKREEEANEAKAKEASDVALLAAVRAMDLQEFEEGRRLLNQAMELWPESAEARYALNFLDSTRPLPRLMREDELDFVATDLGVDGEGRLIVQSEKGRLFEVNEGGEVSDYSGELPKSPEEIVDEDLEVRIVKEGVGMMGFRDLSTNVPVSAPLIFGTGSEKCVYWADEKVAVAAAGNGLRWWNLEGLRRTNEVTSLKEKVMWMGFDRTSTDMWMLDEDFEIREWNAGGEVKGYGSVGKSTSKVVANRWMIGEGHTRGLLPGKTGVLGFLQMGVWRFFTPWRKPTCLTQPRDRDEFFLGMKSGGVWHQVEGKLYQKLGRFSAEVERLSIDAAASVVVGLLRDGRVEVMNLESKKVSPVATKGAVNGLCLLDGGVELILAHEDGTVEVWDLDQGQLVRTISVCRGALHVVPVPGRREFLAIPTGEVTIRRFSSVTGEEIGKSLRHKRGVAYCFFSKSKEILYSIDQGKSGPGTFRVWSIRLGREIAPGLEHPDQILWATVLGGRRIATSCEDLRLRRWWISEE